MLHKRREKKKDSDTHITRFEGHVTRDDERYQMSPSTSRVMTSPRSFIITRDVVTGNAICFRFPFSRLPLTSPALYFSLRCAANLGENHSWQDERPSCTFDTRFASSASASRYIFRSAVNYCFFNDRKKISLNAPLNQIFIWKKACQNKIVQTSLL